MAVDARNLSLMVFPQQWSGSELIANLLLLPTGDPTASVGTELPFSRAQPVLRAAFLPGFDKPCWDPTIDPTLLVYSSLSHITPPSPEQPGLNQPPFKADIFNGLAQQFTPSVPTRAATNGSVKKDLPQTYLVAAGASTPDSAFFASVDGYGCDLRGTRPHTVPVPSRTIAWGEVFSHALRQPLLAQAIGMSYLDVHIPFSLATMAGGGWLWLEIDITNLSNWYAALVTSSTALPANQQPVRSYAARIPPLSGPQKIFSAVLFPTLPTTPKAGSDVLDEAQYEADLYVNGFAQIVHAYQPDSVDAIVENDQTLVPGTDAGLQIGWDDEQVTTWLQRQVQTAQDMAAGNAADEFPLSVQGYRVDARQVPDGNVDPLSPTPAWNSLVIVNASVTAGDLFSASAIEELTVEPTPVSNGGSTNFWLPRYFAHWRGRSLVVNDPYAYAFGAGDAPKAYPQNPSAPQFGGTLTEILNIGLRYGRWYQFRARFADLTGGGPAASDSAHDMGVATVRFLRYVPPKAPAITQDRPTAPSTIAVNRPRLNYPEMVLAGAATDADLASLLNQLQSGQINSVFVPDPDVVTLEIIVETQAPSHDKGNSASMRDMSVPPEPGDLDGRYRVVYRHQIPFTGATLNLSIQPQPFSQIRLIPEPAPGSTTLPVPTGRNLRIRMRGLGAADNTYWGSSLASTGLVTDVQVRYETVSEASVLLLGSAAEQLQAFYLRDDPAAPQDAVMAAGVLNALSSGNLAPGLQTSLSSGFRSSVATPLERLAQALRLPVNGQTLTGPPGRRVLFGAQNTLRHSMTQDLSSITFSSLKDLIGHWIVVIRVTLDRDWTYSGIAQNGSGQTGFVFNGGASMKNPNPSPVEVGRINLPGVVSQLSVQPTGDPAQRDQTDLIFFATVDSTVGPDQFPDVTSTTWSLTATFSGSPTTSVPLWTGAVNLPVTLNPRQIPKLVSAGLAESPYVADAKYAATEQRQRGLWFEFDSPPGDPNDEYFFRVLAYGPDPLLVSKPSDLPTQSEPSLPIDPEWVRMIAAGDTNDDAGVGAMTQLDAARAPLSPSGRALHYLVPLPDSLPPSALELFGFWTIELRVGHTLWSTAQARYGRPLRVSGVQFPVPPLAVSVDRELAPAMPAIVAVANLAQAVFNGVSLTNPLNPQTEIWFLLYAQVQRVDGQAWRNILLEKVPGTPLTGLGGTPVGSASDQNKQIPVKGVFAQKDVEAWLQRWRLPANTPTSVLAVELFNVEANVIRGDFFARPPKEAIAQQDPLGSQLGARRILRVSPLTRVRAVC
jgi:hypothetical protein